MGPNKLYERTISEINKMLAASGKELESDCKKGELLGFSPNFPNVVQARVLSIGGGKSLIIALTRPENNAFPILCSLYIAVRNMDNNVKFDYIKDTNAELAESEDGKIREDDSANVERMIEYLTGDEG